MALHSLPRSGNRWIVGHRGDSGRCPENTRISFAAAVTARADAIECDLQLTADDRIVICHDSTLDRFGHPGIDITDETLDRLTALDVGSWFGPAFHGERLMTLDELLREFGSRLPIMLELKTDALTAPRITTMVRCVADLVTEFRARDTVSFLCFDIDVLEQLYHIVPWAVLMLNTRAPQQIDNRFLEERPWLAAVDGSIYHLSDVVVRTIHEQQRTAVCFTCNTIEEIVKARDLGVDAVITNEPELARHLLNNQIPPVTPASDTGTLLDVPNV